MKKSTSLAFLACVLLFFIAVSAASPLDDDEISIHDKRNKKEKVCPQHKRNVLDKRNYEKKCPCALARSVFEGKFEGLFIFGQDECGTITTTGFFSKGFETPGKYKFKIVDHCDHVLYDLGTK